MVTISPMGAGGLVVHHTAAKDLIVDALLLSCRVLGRGVEQRLLAHLGGIATNAGCARIRFRTRITQRNVPVREFLAGVDGVAVTEEAGIFTAVAPL